MAARSDRKGNPTMDNGEWQDWLEEEADRLEYEEEAREWDDSEEEAWADAQIERQMSAFFENVG